MKRAFICFLSAVFILCAVGICGCDFGGINPDGDSQTNTTNPNNQNNNKYSGILNDVLNSSYYNGLIEQSKNGTSAINAIEPIPYSFLSKQGFDIDALKHDLYGVGAYCYYKEGDENNLFLKVSAVTNHNGSDVRNSYLLKYKLTDKEIDDLTMLYNGNYIQSAFFIQELDKQKTPTVINSSKMDKTSYTTMIEALRKKKALQGLFDKNKIGSFTPLNIVKAEDEEDGYRLKISVTSAAESYRPVTSRQMCELDLLLYWNAGVSIKNGVIKIKDGAFDVENKTEPINITYLFTEYKLIKNNSLNK